jgi:uncharacterized protein YodC (DUF2158 family)
MTQAEFINDDREPPLRIGDIVRLNSGGPRCLVVDFSDSTVVVAWRDPNQGIVEREFPRDCFHRVPLI